MIPVRFPTGGKIIKNRPLLVSKMGPEGSGGGRPEKSENGFFQKCSESMPRASGGLGGLWGPLGGLWGALWGPLGAPWAPLGPGPYFRLFPPQRGVAILVCVCVRQGRQEPVASDLRARVRTARCPPAARPPARQTSGKCGKSLKM